MSNPGKILVVGGGFTGLTAALRLSADKNCAITVVERSDRLGGLAAGFPLGGTWLEQTYHHLFLTDTHILGLVRELGLQDQLVWCDSSVAIFRDGKIHAFKTPLDLLRFSPCSFTGRLRTGIMALYLKHRKNWRGFAAQTAQAWLTRACGASAMASIWTPLLKGKFDRHYDSVSMAWFWARLHIRANSRARGGGEKLGYFRGGFNVVTTALEQELRRRGVTLRTGVTVEKITGDHTAVLNGETVPFDACLFTGPSPAFAALLPSRESLRDYAAKLRSLEYLGATCLVFTSDQNLGDYYWINVNEPDAPFLVFLNHTRLMDPSHYGGKHVYYLGAYLSPEGKLFSLSDGELTELWFGYLKKLFPEFDATRVAERHIFRFRAAQHIVDTRYAERIPEYRTPLPGVFLANFSQIYPEDRGTNFAVREGGKIAELIRRRAESGGRRAEGGGQSE
jgi:protoporphyrinogen oxidase